VTDKAANTDHPVDLEPGRASPASAAGGVVWCIALLLVALPFVRWRGFLYPHYAEAVLLQCITLALLLLWAAPIRLWRWPRINWPEGILIAYAAFCLLGSLWAGSPRMALVGSVPILFPICLALVIGRTVDIEKQGRLIGQVIVVAGLLAAGTGLIFAAGRSNTEAVFGHRNFLAIFLLPPIMLCLAEAFPSLWSGGRAKRGPLRWGAPAALLATFLMVWALALCTSAGSLVALAGGVVWLVAFRLSRRWRRLLIAVFVVTLISVPVVLSRPVVEDRLAPLEKGQRWFLWKGAAEMVAQKPVVGWGTGAFIANFQIHKPQPPKRYNLLTSVSWHPHNEWLLVLVEGGVVGLLLYLSGLLGALRNAVRRNQERPAETQLLVWAIGAAFAAMTLQGLVTVALRWWAPAAMYWVLIGLLLASARKGHPRAGVVGSGAWIRFVVVVAIVVGAVIMVVHPGVQAEWRVGGGRRGLISAWKNKKLSDDAYMAHAEANYRIAFKRSRHLPDYYRTWKYLCDIYRKPGHIEKAIVIHESLEAEAPGYGDVRRTIARLYVELGKHKKTIVERRECLALALRWFGAALAQNRYYYQVHLDVVALLLQRGDKNALPRIERHLRAIAEAPINRDNDYYRHGALQHVSVILRLLDEHESGVAGNFLKIRQRLFESFTPAMLKKLKQRRNGVAGAV
jgi:O-antigen ligase